MMFRKCNTDNAKDRKLLLYILDRAFDDFHEMKDEYVKSLENECDIQFIMFEGVPVGTIELKGKKMCVRHKNMLFSCSRRYNHMLIQSSKLEKLCYNFKMLWSYEEKRMAMEFSSFGILPSHQRRGIGTRAMRELLKIHDAMISSGGETKLGYKLYKKFR